MSYSIELTVELMNIYLSIVPVVFVDTFTLFPESISHLREVEAHYGFQSKIYNAQGDDIILMYDINDADSDDGDCNGNN